jgi:hypothetical protein
VREQGGVGCGHDDDRPAPARAGLARHRDHLGRQLLADRHALDALALAGAVVGLDEDANRPAAVGLLHDPGGGADAALEAVADHARAPADVALPDRSRGGRPDRLDHVLGAHVHARRCRSGSRPRSPPPPVSSPLPFSRWQPANTGSVSGSSAEGNSTVTPVRTASPRIRVACPTRTPATSVIALPGPGRPVPMVMPRSRARIGGVSQNAGWRDRREQAWTYRSSPPRRGTR